MRTQCTRAGQSAGRMEGGRAGCAGKLRATHGLEGGTWYENGTPRGQVLRFARRRQAFSHDHPLLRPGLRSRCVAARSAGSPDSKGPLPGWRAQVAACVLCLARQQHKTGILRALRLNKSPRYLHDSARSAKRLEASSTSLVRCASGSEGWRVSTPTERCGILKLTPCTQNCVAFITRTAQRAVRAPL